jgi:L-amino acid N-acyltransferase YncA
VLPEANAEARIRPLQRADWEAVCEIYREGIATGNSTFEKTAPDWEQWDRGHLSCCRLVVESGHEVVAWAALSPVSGRCVYSGVAEASLYVAARARGRGVGLTLLRALISESERGNIWMLQGGIFPENTASLALCKKAGFRVVGVREGLGCMDGRWRDVVLVERRSDVVGV